MKVYSKDRDNVFSYVRDWAGFNISGKVLNELYGKGNVYKIKDLNPYDNKLIGIQRVLHKTHKTNYYLIGSLTNDKATLNHELCHAFYNIDKEYKRKANEIVSTLASNIRKKINKLLEEIGYCKKVLLDETQAYLTWDKEYISSEITLTKKQKANFEKVHSKLQELFFTKHKK